MKILMVCLGNICRSPIAEGVMKHKLKSLHFNYMVDSAGILSEHSGETPDRRAQYTALQHQIDISDQAARQIRRNDFTEFDLIFAMDLYVYKKLISQASNENEHKVHLFLEYAGFEPGSEVPDPYYGGQEGFETVFKLIDKACDAIVEKIKKS